MSVSDPRTRSGEHTPRRILFYFGASSAVLLLPTDTSLHDLCDSSVRSLGFGFQRKPGRAEWAGDPEGASKAGKRLSQ